MSSGCSSAFTEGALIQVKGVHSRKIYSFERAQFGTRKGIRDFGVLRSLKESVGYSSE